MSFIMVKMETPTIWNKEDLKKIKSTIELVENQLVYLREQLSRLKARKEGSTCPYIGSHQLKTKTIDQNRCQ